MPSRVNTSFDVFLSHLKDPRVQYQGSFIVVSHFDYFSPEQLRLWELTDTVIQLTYRIFSPGFIAIVYFGLIDDITLLKSLVSNVIQCKFLIVGAYKILNLTNFRKYHFCERHFIFS